MHLVMSTQNIVIWCYIHILLPDQQHYGILPEIKNPYVRGSTITKEKVMECLEEVSTFSLYPVQIRAKRRSIHTVHTGVIMLITLQEGSIATALTTPESTTRPRPPSVSDSKLCQRFDVNFIENEEHEVQLGTLFNPDLQSYKQDDAFIEILRCDVIALCSVACIHHENSPKTNTTRGLVSPLLPVLFTHNSPMSLQELNNEQELFCNISKPLFLALLWSIPNARRRAMNIYLGQNLT